MSNDSITAQGELTRREYSRMPLRLYKIYDMEKDTLVFSAECRQGCEFLELVREKHPKVVEEDCRSKNNPDGKYLWTRCKV